MPFTPTYSPIPHVPATAGTQLATMCRCSETQTSPVPVGDSATHYVRGGMAAVARTEAKGEYGRQGAQWDYVAQCVPPIFPSHAVAPRTSFRHTLTCTWPWSTTTVWRNLEQNLQHAPILYSSFIIYHSSLSFTFSAKERDPETGLSYFGSRYYSSDLSIWLSVDPMSDKYASLSPYTYCADNPVKLVDPNGEEMNPIYDRFGYFLGTDDRGLQGDLIVMDRKNFQQNMSHDDALNNSTYFDMYHYSEAETRCLDHFNSLKDRPDYDGFVTISEGIQWAKDHPNAKNHPNPYNTLYIDAAQLDLGFLTVENSGLKVGDDYVNINLYDFVDRKSPRSVNTAYALGNTGIKLLDNQGTISFSGDVYDWDYHKKSPMRNSLIFLERLRTGLDDNHGFKVCIYGTAKLDQTWPY